MQKRILPILLVCVLALTFTGCSCDSCGATESAPSFDVTLPDTDETCEYSITKTYVGGKKDDHKVVANGTYRSVLSKSPTDPVKSLQLVNSFDMTYNTEPKTVTRDVLGRYIVNTGLRDSYRATADFRRDSLVPNSASKDFKIAQRPLYDDEEGHAKFLTDDDKLTADLPEGVLYRYAMPEGNDKYADPRGYEYTVDYAANLAQFHTTVGKTDGKTHFRDYKDERREIKISDSLRWDNEQLALLVRALAATKKKGSATFYLSSLYDSYTAGKYVRYTMSLSCGDKTKDTVVAIDPEKYYLSTKEEECKKTESGKYEVPCVTATVSISADAAGPGIEFLVIDPSVTITHRNDDGSQIGRAHV